MKKLFLVEVMMVVSSVAQAGQCEDLAQQAANVSANNVSDLVRVNQINQTLQSLGCGGGQQRQAEPVQSPPQYVPSIGQWCQVVNGVTNCWK